MWWFFGSQLIQNQLIDLKFVEDVLLEENFVHVHFSFDEGVEGLDNLVFNNLDITGDWVDDLVDLFGDKVLDLEVINVDLSLEEILDDFFQVESLDSLFLLSLSLLNKRWSVHHFGFVSDQNIQNVLVHVDFVEEDLVHVQVGFVQFWEDCTEQILLDELRDDKLSINGFVVLVDQVLGDQVLEEEVGVQVVWENKWSLDSGGFGVLNSVHHGGGGFDVVVDHLLFLLLFEGGEGSDDSGELLLFELFHVNSNDLSVLLNNWDNVFVKENWVNKELTEGGLGEELLEFSGSQVELEGGGVDVLTEKGECHVLLEDWHGDELTEGVGVEGDVGWDVELECGWHDDSIEDLVDSVDSGGHGVQWSVDEISSEDLLLLLLLLSDWEFVESAQEEFSLDLLLSEHVLTLWVELTVFDVVKDISVNSGGQLSANGGGNQENSNTSLHFEIWI